jgi:nucleotide-binding universal stress UspA family protein
MAGPDGTVVLLQIVDEPGHDSTMHRHHERAGREEAQAYLDLQSQALREQGAQVEAAVLEGHRIASAVDLAIARLNVDMIACATHGRAFLGRLIRGSVAWEVLTDSTVPVLLRHAGAATVSPPSGERRILVPLDGSSYAEAALPLAEELAHEWDASIWLARVVPTLALEDPYLGDDRAVKYYSSDEKVREAEIYLDRVRGRSQRRDTQAYVLVRSDLADALIRSVGNWGITDVVMTSHGRTGVKLMLMGSVANTLVRYLNLPLIVIPPGAVRAASQASEHAAVVS